MYKFSCAYLLLLLLCIFSCYVATAQDPPTGFASTVVSSLWDEAVGIEFSKDGTEMWVWERKGKLWLEKNNQRQLLLDISPEVGGYSDHGFLGFALHPHFDQNGYIYLLYVVDRHHLINFGTAAYNPATNDYNKATIGRLTRYTATTTVNGYFIDPASRKILIGDLKTNGIPQTSGTHGVGSLVFGTDHTLLVSTGDGASPYNNDVGNLNVSHFAQALQDGIITPTENVGVFRAQLLNSLAGKILRIDPETGAGIPSNPFYDPTRPNAPISKVWALGLRNPFRMNLKPGTGSHSPADGDPGILYIGDVGFNHWEEISVVDRPGLNLGWPIYEGLDISPFNAYAPQLTLNRDAPNPLYQVNGCAQQFFYFQDLLKQETPTGTATFPNPCNPAVTIPSTVRTFVHTRPLIDWRHQDVPPTTRTGTFNGSIATITGIGAGSPVAGTPFIGSSATGGVFYTGTDFPAEYQNTYFFGDYTGSWIRNMVVDANDRPVAIRNFVNNNASVVSLKAHPTGEGLYYVNFGSEIRRIYFSANRPPIARASSDKAFGPSPLDVQFTGSTSSDPENMPLAFEWNFGDGTPLSTLPNPTHTFGGTPGVPVKYTVKLKVTDNQGVSNETTLVISTNNTPPDVTITSPADNTLYPISQGTTYPLQTTVTDDGPAPLTYNWQVILHHNEHEHPDQSSTLPEASALISPLGCDGQVYYYRIVLTVTDAAGGTTTKEVKIYPDCNGEGLPIPVINWPAPVAITQGTPLSATQLNATATLNGTTVPGTFTYIPPLGTVLPLGNSQQLTANFIPSNTNLYSPTSKSVVINVVPAGNQPPQLVLGMPDQSATVGIPFTFTVPSQTFTDPDPGTVLTYSAALSNGNPLPAWLLFNAATHTFTGTPTAADLGTQGVRVTVSDGAGTASDVFALTVNESTGTGTFYRAINVNGPALVIDNHNWEASGTAPNFTYSTNQRGFVNQNVTLIPSTDANRSTMIRSSIYGSNMTFNIASVPAGNYLVWIYVWEDNFSQTFTVSLEGAVVQSNYASGPPGTWKKLGPFQVSINDGAINIGSTGQDANFSGIEIWTVGPPALNQPPVVAVPLVDQTATAGIQFDFTFPAGSFSDPDPGTVLTFTSKLSNDTPLPAWLNFNGNTRTFSGTPTASDVGPYDILVQASDGAGGMVTDVFALSVAGVIQVTPIITWANPAAITVGMALTGIQLNATASYNGSSVAGTMTYTPPSGTVLEVGTGQTLSVNFTPANSTLYTTASKTVTIDVNEKVTPLITWNDPAAIDFGTPLSATQLNATATHNGSAVAGTFVYAPPSGTILNVGNGQTLTVNFTPSNATLYNNASKSVVIDVTPAKVTPVITWNNPSPITSGTPLSSTQLNATAGFNGVPLTGVFTYNPGSGTVLSEGLAQVLSVTFDPDNTTLYNSATKTVNIDVNPVTPPTSFYRAINLNGGALVIDGNSWQASTGASGFSYSTDRGVFANQAVTLVPSTDANRATMIRSSIWGVNMTLNLVVPNGNYQVFLYVWEDNNPAIFSVRVEGAVVLSNYNSGTGGVWRKLGPYPVAITDGVINVSSFGGGHANFSGLEVWRVNAVGNQPPVVSQPIADQSTSAGSPYSFTFPTSTFTDPDAGTTLTYAAALSNGGLLPSWLNFSPATRTFGGTPGSGDVTAIDVRVTASDGAGGSVSDVFALTVNPVVKVTPLLTWNNPTAITSGTALSSTQLNATATVNGTPVAGTFVYTPPSGTVLPIGNGQTLTVDFTPTNSTLYNPASKSVTIDVNAAPKVTPVLTWANPQPIIVGTPLSATQLNATATVNGSAVAGTFVYTPGTGTVLNSGLGQPLSVTFTPTNTTLYNSVSATVSIDVTTAPANGFYRAINLNGPGLVIDGNNWEASGGAANFTFSTDRSPFVNQAVPLIPVTDANRSTMIRSSIWGVNITLNLGVPSGNYQVYLYVWEDNAAVIYSIRVEGALVLSNYNSGPAGTWRRLGPYNVAINDGAINVVAFGGHANLSGLEVHTGNPEGREDIITAVETPEQNGELQLSAYPNPFSQQVTVEFTTPATGTTSLGIYDIHGIRIRQLFEGNIQAGSSEHVVVDSDDLSDGVYVLQLSSGGKTKHLKLALTR